MPLRQPHRRRAPRRPETDRRRRWRRRLAGAATVVALALAVGLVVGRRGSAESGYRTAIATIRSVHHALDRVGTIEPVSQASVGFPVGGDVASVSVSVGDTVTTGQALASLDTATMEATLAERKAALDAAELTLERALDGEDVSGVGGNGGGSPGGTGSEGSVSATPSALLLDATPSAVLVSVSTSMSRSTPATSGADVSSAELAQARQAVVDAQKEVDASLAAAQEALDDAGTVCAAVASSDGESASTPSSSTTSPSTPSSSTPSSSTIADDTVTACRDALAVVQGAQQAVADDQAAVNEAAAALDDLLAQLAQELEDAGGRPTGGNGGSTPPDQGGRTALPGTGGAGAGGASTPPDQGGGTALPGADGPQGDASAGASTSSGPTSAELISYQKAVDAAATQVTVAEQALAQATLVSPIAGTVQAVNLEVGDTVSAGSSTAAVVVVGDGGYEVTTTVTVDDLADVAVGQAATVTPDGSDAAVDGEIVRVGVVAGGSGTSTTYPVTIGLTGAPDGLRNGAVASVSIVTGETHEAIAVPTSAVTVDGPTSTVAVLEGGEAATTIVQVGVMGDVWTEVTDGLAPGDTVVLADLDEPLPSSATDGSSTGGFGPGPQGGFGGFPGAGPGG